MLAKPSTVGSGEPERLKQWETEVPPANLGIPPKPKRANLRW
jgi:hypothetical protein